MALTGFLHHHSIIGPIVYVVVRALTGIIAPIPGALVDIAGVAVYGWRRALFLSEIGIMLGAATSFGIARHFRERAVRNLAPLRTVQKLEVQLSQREQFWAWVAIRVPTNALFDYMNYAAGLTNCDWPKFLLSTFLGSLPSVVLFFYVTGTALHLGLVYGGIELLGLLMITWFLPRMIRIIRARRHPL